MMADGYLVGDGSWNLRVCVTNLQVERTLRVKGDLHIGGVMLKLVEDLGTIFCDNYLSQCRHTSDE
ncbi:Unc-112-related protein [Gryllus bimaculatus]|nr:Unc-112-related protein [Gryllus bimaculatus]